MLKLLRALRAVRDETVTAGADRLAASGSPLARHEAEHLLRTCLNGFLVALGQGSPGSFVQSMTELAEREGRLGQARRAEAMVFAFDQVAALADEEADSLEAADKARRLLDAGRQAFLRTWLRGKAEEDERSARALAAYAETAEIVPTIVYSTDREGRLTDIGHQAAEMLGYRKEELIGQHYSVLMLDDEARRFGYFMQERRTAERATRRGKVSLRAADGALHTFEVSSTGVYGPEGEYLGADGIARAAGHDGARLEYQLDGQGRILAISEAAAQALGYEAEELVGQHFAVLMNDRERARVGRLFGERRRDHRAANGIRVALTTRDGQRREFEISAVGRYDEAGEYVGTAGLGSDVTERSALEHRISIERRRYRAVCDAVGSPLLVVAAERLVRDANVALLRSRSRSILGSPCYTTVYGQPRTCPWCRVDQVLASGEPAAAQLVESPADGRRYQVCFAPLRDEHGRASEVLEVLVDVTDLCTSLEQAGEARRCAATAGLLSLLADPAAAELARLLATPGVGEPNAAAETALAGLRVPDQVSVELDLLPSTPAVGLAPEALVALVTALARNALEAMPSGGELTIETAGDAARGVVLRVADTGVGLSPETLLSAPLPGFTQRAGHAGLGLTLAEALAHAAGGRLTLSSAPDAGTLVEVWLPAGSGS
jgi:PAS domain S-box-containing protein